MHPTERPTQKQTILAFASIYLIWGSTYLAIRYAVESLPAFTMAGARFVFAGSALFIWALAKGEPAPKSSQWVPASIGGCLLLLIGNGGIVWAAHMLPSGFIALLVGAEPMYLVLMDWFRPGGRRPRLTTLAGLVLGFGGLVLLLAPRSSQLPTSRSWLGVFSVLLASIAWAAGSLYSRSSRLPDSARLSTGMQMQVGGVLLLIVGVAAGEWRLIHFPMGTWKSWIAFSYLLTFGSFIGFTAYVWLLRTTTAARVATYAYINPLIAVFLGWLVANEPVNLRVILSTVIITLSVALILDNRRSLDSRIPKMLGAQNTQQRTP